MGAFRFRRYTNSAVGECLWLEGQASLQLADCAILSIQPDLTQEAESIGNAIFRILILGNWLLLEFPLFLLKLEPVNLSAC